MSEAFEIGVTLALSDGVSDGIARARREMAAFEQVLTTGGVSVAQLRKAAMEAVQPARPRAENRHPETRRPDADQAGERMADAVTGQLGGEQVGERTAHAVARMSVAAPDHTPDEDWDKTRRDARPADAIENPGRQAAPQSDAVPPAPAASAEAGRAAWWPGNEAGAEHQAPTPAERPATRAAPAAGRIDEGNALAPINLIYQMPQAAESTWRRGDGAPYAPSAMLPSGAEPPLGHDGPPDFSSMRDAGAAGYPSDVPAPSAPGELPGVAAPDVALVTQAAPSADAGRVGWQAGASQSPHVTPAAPTVSEIAGPSASADGHPSSDEGTHQPAEGDVFLDGMLVGRWMSRFLAKEAGRASVGPTGFDARRGRLLPGATVGN